MDNNHKGGKIDAVVDKEESVERQIKVRDVEI